MDETFASEEITNNDPEINGIVSVMDSRWRSTAPYDVASTLRRCGVDSSRQTLAGLTWTTTRDSNSATWAATSFKEGEVRLIMVLTTGADVAPDRNCLLRLVSSWTRL